MINVTFAVANIFNFFVDILINLKSYVLYQKKIKRQIFGFPAILDLKYIIKFWTGK